MSIYGSCNCLRKYGLLISALLTESTTLPQVVEPHSVLMLFGGTMFLHGVCAVRSSASKIAHMYIALYVSGRGMSSKVAHVLTSA